MLTWTDGPDHVRTTRDQHEASTMPAKTSAATYSNTTRTLLAPFCKSAMAAAGWFVAAAGALALALSFCSATAAAAGRPTSPASAAASSLDCGTVTSLLAGCAAFVRRGAAAGPVPTPGTRCCEGVADVYAVAVDSADNWRSVCGCMTGLVRRYRSNASAIALLPGLCGVSLGFTAHAVTYCTSIP